MFVVTCKCSGPINSALTEAISNLRVVFVFVTSAEIAASANSVCGFMNESVPMLAYCSVSPDSPDSLMSAIFNLTLTASFIVCGTVNSLSLFVLANTEVSVSFKNNSFASSLVYTSDLLAFVLSKIFTSCLSALVLSEVSISSFVYVFAMPVSKAFNLSAVIVELTASNCSAVKVSCLVFKALSISTVL